MFLSFLATTIWDVFLFMVLVIHAGPDRSLILIETRTTNVTFLQPELRISQLMFPRVGSRTTSTRPANMESGIRREVYECCNVNYNVLFSWENILHFSVYQLIATINRVTSHLCFVSILKGGSVCMIK